MIKRSEMEMNYTLRKDEEKKSRKDSNKEVITWKSENKMANIYSIRSKKSRHHYYDEIGRHLVEYDKLQSNNEVSNSPFLINCKGCEYNIGRRKNTGLGCLIYIEKDIATTIKGRWEKTEGVKYIKPYSTAENIDKNNEIIFKKVKSKKIRW